MGNGEYENMNAVRMDVLREIGSIGNGNAATALSNILDAKVSMALPSVEILGFNEALLRAGDPEEIVAAIFMEMSGEIEGVMLFIIKKDFAADILKRVLGKEEVCLETMEEMESSVLIEIGNIMISSYTNALSSLARISMDLSVPQMAVNMLGGILSLPLAMLGLESDTIMMIKGQFSIEGRELNSDILLLPDMKSLDTIIKKLGVE